MKIVFINNFFVRFMVSEIPRMSVFVHCPYSLTFPYIAYICNLNYTIINKNVIAFIITIIHFRILD